MVSLSVQIVFILFNIIAIVIAIGIGTYYYSNIVIYNTLNIEHGKVSLN